MRIIVTRPKEDAATLCEKLVLRGHEPIAIPLLKIQPRLNVELPDRPYQAICLTSANGVRCLNDIAAIAKIKCVAVGQQSLKAAQDAGFKNGIAAGGDVVGLALYMAEHFKPEDGPLLYISGAETSGDLEARLREAKFSVDRIITYDAVPTVLLDHKAQIENADAVVLYSPRTAKLWLQVVTELGISVLHLKHICLSANVAACLPQSWVKAVALTPTEDAVLALLDSVAKAE